MKGAFFELVVQTDQIVYTSKVNSSSPDSPLYETDPHSLQGTSMYDKEYL